MSGTSGLDQARLGASQLNSTNRRAATASGMGKKEGARYQPQLDINGPVAQETAVLVSDTIRDSIDLDSAALLAPQRLDFQQRSALEASSQQEKGGPGDGPFLLVNARCLFRVERIRSLVAD